MTPFLTLNIALHPTHPNLNLSLAMSLDVLTNDIN